jgi:L-ascorbate metabolism protein UlaG (beta-lactamase superfamily)
MKRIISICALLFLATVTFAQHFDKVQSARVTYLANTGFMVEVGQTKMLFDAMFQNGMDRYLTPEETTVEQMKLALPPFDNVSMIFITHLHSDAFDPYLTLQHMLHNPHAKLFCPQQVINKMKIFTEDYPKIKNRIVETTPVLNRYDRMVVNGFEIFAMNIKHSEMMNDHVENIGYVVNVDGVKVFHSGGSTPQTLSDLRGLRLSDLGIDIAFLNDRYGLKKGSKLTNEIVAARYNVLMHFELYITDAVLDNYSDRSKLTPKPHIFRVRNDFQDFYINDYFVPYEEPSLSLSIYTD